MTHLRRIMLEALQRHNYSDVTSRRAFCRPENP